MYMHVHMFQNKWKLETILRKENQNNSNYVYISLSKSWQIFEKKNHFSCMYQNQLYQFNTVNSVKKEKVDHIQKLWNE